MEILQDTTEDYSYIRDESFPKQDAFILDPSQFVVGICTRRAGKTHGLGRRFLRAMKKHPGSMSRYIALTRDSAKDIMWPVLQELDEKHRLNAVFTESNLTMTLPNGSKLRLFGADMKNFVRRLRGAKSPAVAIDELQEFNSDHIISLIDDILTPTLADYEGSWLALTGTPGPIPRGFFYDITTKGQADYSVHRWSLYENPYLPDPKGFVEKLRIRKGWSTTHPTYLREYQGQWVLDLDSLLIRWDEKKNDYKQQPIAAWEYLLGVDIGHKDADALAVIGWNNASQDIYLIEEHITAGQDITELSNQIKAMMDKYNVVKIVMDEGALGKKIGEEIRRRKQLPIHPADKARKMENVAFLNEWLRLGKFKAKRTSRFVSDSMQVQIDHEKSTPEKTILKKGFHSDIIDAVLYAFKESPAWAYAKEPDKPKYGTPEWAKDQVSEMEEAAEEYFKEQQLSEKEFGIDW